MSYILDALRRADAERERDPARGIHAQPGTGVPAQARSRVPAWGWAAGAFVVLAAAGLVSWLRPVPPPPAVAMTPSPSVVTPAPVAVPRPAPALVVPVAAAVLPPPPALPEPVRVAPTPVAPTARVAAPAPAVRVAAAPAAAPIKAPAIVTPASPAASAAPAAERIYNVAELPVDVQGQLPKLAISGAVHSDNAAQRMLIVNGQVVNEGAELAPGVVLEQIRARNAVLRFRGYRYSVGY